MATARGGIIIGNIFGGGGGGGGELGQFGGKLSLLGGGKLPMHPPPQMKPCLHSAKYCKFTSSLNGTLMHVARTCIAVGACAML